ncbi:MULTISPECIES: tripartite tricarboxylate transporter TctB family protein [Pantoea]|uniref:tripartite tricarboxylate transporter TctB family protein n=1 Tax=Pantoea TaxID=53335 RepID=UPI0015616E1A|nr:MULTISPECIES: tripartite tricarboxylate transporter TctB family protein [Pantoea]NQS88076.1 tripartite tricarboxylate transporter TctB family protein [Pantoea allii]
MSDRIFATLWLLMCLAGLVIAWQIQSEYSYEPVGPRPFPLILLSLMAFCALMLLLRKPDDIQWPTAATMKRLVALAVMMLVYGGMFETLGFPLSTSLLTFGLGMLFGARWWAALLSGAVMGWSLFYAFDRLLDVTLPAGSLFN